MSNQLHLTAYDDLEILSVHPLTVFQSDYWLPC